MARIRSEVISHLMRGRSEGSPWRKSGATDAPKFWIKVSERLITSSLRFECPYPTSVVSFRENLPGTARRTRATRGSLYDNVRATSRSCVEPYPRPGSPCGVGRDSSRDSRRRAQTSHLAATMDGRTDVAPSIGAGEVERIGGGRPRTGGPLRVFRIGKHDPS